MNRLAGATIVAAISLIVLATPRADHAQQIVPMAGGDALQAKAEKVRSALLTGTPEEFLSSLAPWIQGRAAKAALGSIPQDTDPEYEPLFLRLWLEEYVHASGLDPKNVLGVKTYADLSKITVAQRLALAMGYYRLRATPGAVSACGGKWFLVDRKVETESRPMASGHNLRLRGTVTFIGEDSADSVTISCASESDTWHVDQVAYRVAGEMERLDTTYVGGDWSAVPVPETMTDRAREEASTLMATMRGMTRVHYARSGAHEKIKTLTGSFDNGGCDLKDAELAGQRMRVRDHVVGQKTGAKLMCEPVREGSPGGYGVYTFSWAGGDGTFIWYDTLEDLQAAHPEFK
jgi:hypothetical protein